MSTNYGVIATGDKTAMTQGALTPHNNNVPTDDEKRDIDTPPNDEKHTKAASLNEEPVREKNSSPAETLGNDEEDDDSEMELRHSIVQALARSYSQASGANIHGHGNPFFSDETSPLNPNSPNFNGREWAKSIVALVQQDGHSFRSTGVTFQNLNVFGYGAASDYQKDVANVWLSAGSGISRLTGGKGRRIDILRNFDGVVHKGEMLVVLGPPGSGCSTMLKTIAGETNGLYLDEGSYFNYQGKSRHFYFMIRRLQRLCVIHERHVPFPLCSPQHQKTWARGQCMRTEYAAAPPA